MNEFAFATTLTLRRLRDVREGLEGVSDMNAVLLGVAATFAAVAFPTAPAQAQRWTDPGFMAAANVSVHRGSSGSTAEPFGGPMSGQLGRHRHDGFRHDRRGRGGFDNGVFLGPWAYDYEDRTFEPDSYNDWWHDRPERAYPRWVQHNDGCPPERMWQGGGMWRCSW
jgi:hypothetical protein